MGNDDREQLDVSRRDLGALLGILGGGAAISALSAACSSESGSSALPEPLGRQIEAIGGTSVIWFNTINGPCTNGSTFMLDTPGPSNAYQVAIVFGFNNPGDGGGGIFYWDYASAAKADGGTIFQASNPAMNCQRPITTGRWIRVFSGALDIRWFGASTSRIDNAPAIQAAIAAAQNASGGTVLIPPGSYTVQSASLVIESSNMTLTGSGDATVVASTSATMAVVIQVGAPASGDGGSATVPTNVTIRDLSINVNGSNRSNTIGYAAIKVIGNNCLIQNVTAANAQGASTAPVSTIATGGTNNRIIGCVALNCGVPTNTTQYLADGFYCGPPASGYSTQNLIANCVANVCTGSGFVLESTNYSGIVGCSADRCGQGAAITNSVGPGAGIGNFVSDLTVGGCTGSAGSVLIGPTVAKGTVTNTTVSGLTVTGSQQLTPGLWIGAENASFASANCVQGLVVCGANINITGKTGSPVNAVYLWPGVADIQIASSSFAGDAGCVAILSAGAALAPARITLDGTRIYPGKNGVGIYIGYPAGAAYGTGEGGCDRICVQNCTFVAPPGATYDRAVYAYSSGSGSAANTDVWITNNRVVPGDCSIAYYGGDPSTILSIQLSTAIGLGSGSSATLGTVAATGGTGPKTSTQNSWIQVFDANGNAYWLPAWL